MDSPLQVPFETTEPAAAPAPDDGIGGVEAETLAIQVEEIDGATLIRYQTAWTDLCKRVIEPNVFLEPAFALPLIQHVRYPKRPCFLMVWEDNGPASFGRLLGLFPIDAMPGRRSLDGIVRGFAHKQTSCGVPLVDRDRAAEVLEAVLAWLARRAPAAALVLSDITKEGPFHAELLRFARASSRRVDHLGEHARAVLHRPDDREGHPIPFASAKRRKERGRQFRRLSEVGVRTYTSARTPSEIARATERFLALENNGWKGLRGTSLLADPTLATFTRTMTRLMSHEGKCRIDALEIGGKPVAMGVVVQVGGRAYFWKTAFDETFAPLSPGVQFAIELTQTQLADPGIVSTDSCAVANHPMIDRLWSGRMIVTDLALAIRPGEAPEFARGVRIERLRRYARAKVKTLWLALRHRIGN